MNRDTTNVEPEMYDYTNNNWSYWNSNEKLKEKSGPVECVPGASHQAHTPQVQISRCQTPTTHTKHRK